MRWIRQLFLDRTGTAGSLIQCFILVDPTAPDSQHVLIPLDLVAISLNVS